MKKLFLLAALLFSIVNTTYATNPNDDKTGTIIGKVLDAVLKQPLPYVNVIIKNSKEEILTGSITSEDGTFKIEKIAEGKIIISIQYIGYNTIRKEITIGKGNFDINLGNIFLEEATEGLDEVTVVAETSSVVQKIDRKVINVGKDLTSAGTTASELLNNIQSVSVDSQSGNLSLRGNENVRVLVDGKPSSINVAQLLKQIPSTSIKSIELITNPSAKYSPEGMSGIINIILHKNANQGFNGTIATGVTQGKKTRLNTSLDMNYKTGKVNFFTNYGFNTGKNFRLGNVLRLDNNSRQLLYTVDDDESHLLKLGADIYINDKNTISAYTVQNRFDGFRTNNPKITENNVLVSDSYNQANRESNNETYNLNYKAEFNKKDHNLEFEANFSNAKSPENAINTDIINPSDTFGNYFTDINNSQKDKLVNLDYTNPLSETSKLELGLEYRNNKSENRSITDQSEYIPDGNGGLLVRDTPDIAFNYIRDIYSAYTNYNQEYNKISVQLGARIEQYKINGNFLKGTENLNVTDAIFSVYPSAFVTYNPSEKNQFQVSYSRRVDRPSINQINPIREWSTPRVTSIGNPDLLPQFTNSYEINYTRQLKKGSLSFGTFYRRVNDEISRIVNSDPFNDNNVLLTFTNYKSNNRYGVESSFSYKFTKWWMTNASTDLYLQKQSGVANGTQIQVTANLFNARITNNFTATKNLNLQVFYMFTGGGKSVQFDRKSMSMLNLGASLNVLDKKATINLRANDIFRTMRFKLETVNPYPAKGQFYGDSRTVYLGFDYRFGNGKNKALRRKNRDNNEKSGGGFL